MLPNAFIIGYKNHASRIIKNVLESKCFEKVFVYHPDKNRLSDISALDDSICPTDDFNLTSTCLCIFIASPTHTHYEYLKRLYDFPKKMDSLPYVYCEKPIAANWDEINWLKTNESKLYPTLRVGFNFIYSDFSGAVSRYIKSNEIGLPTSANFQSTHGLAFKPGMGKNWRFVDDSIFSRLLGNLCIHYIHLSLHLFGSIVDSYSIENRACEHDNSDGSLVTLRHVNGTLTSIFVSYATVYSKRFNVFFTDGMIEQLGNHLSVSLPRDVFDSEGEFCEPPKKVLASKNNNRDSTLIISVDRFINDSLEEKIFSQEDFRCAVEASEVVLKLNENMK